MSTPIKKAMRTPIKEGVSDPSLKIKINKLPEAVRGPGRYLTVAGGVPEFLLQRDCRLARQQQNDAGAPDCTRQCDAKPTRALFYRAGRTSHEDGRCGTSNNTRSSTRPSWARRSAFSTLRPTCLQEGGVNAVLEEIIKQVTAAQPAVVVVDSFRTMQRQAADGTKDAEMQLIIQRLAQFLTCWEATTFLVGEYSEAEMRDNPLFTMADGLFWLWQVTERNSVVRKMQIIKLRGQASVPGLHTIRIDGAGLQAFSRTLGLVGSATKPARRRHLSIGIPELDKMLGGGILEGDSLLVAGPSGTGKSALATQFIAEGLRRGEPGIMAIFEERPTGYLHRAGTFGLHLKAAEEEGKLETLYLRPLDLSVDETMQAILDAIKRIGAKRLVIDSLVGFEMALAPGFRADFRESLYRMIGALTGAGVTVLSTVEVEDTFTGMCRSSHYTISFLTDDIIRMRYVEIDGQLRKVMVVIKMRGGNHSKDIREYVITSKGVVIIHPRQTDYTALTTGIPQRIGQREEAAPEPKATQ